MAYKFQLGAFTASGSITAEEGFDAGNQKLENVSEVSNAGGGIKFNLADNENAVTFESGSNMYLKFDTTSGDEFIRAHKPFRMNLATKIQFNSSTDTIGMNGDTGNLEISGGVDIVLSASAGNVVIPHHDGSSTGLVLGADLLTATAAELNVLDGLAQGSILLGDGSGAAAILDAKTDGQIMVGNGTTVTSVAVSGDVTLTNAGVVTIAAGAVEGSMLNSNVVSGAINLASNAIGLSGSVAGQGLEFDGSHAHLEKLSLQLETTNALAVSDNGLDLKSVITGNRTFSNNVEIGGDLFVVGTTTTVNSTSIQVTGSIVFEGSTADGNETTLGVVDPQAARTINLADASGTLIPFAAASTTTISATPAELNLLDAGAGSSVSLASGDGIIIFDADDGVENNSAKKVLMSDISDFVGNNFSETVQTITAATATIDLSSGAQVLANPSGAQTLTLPTPANLEGKILKIKSIGTQTITISANGSENIDGSPNDIVLESDYAAVSVISDGTNYFII